MDQLVNAAIQAEYQLVRQRSETLYSGNEAHSSCYAEIFLEIVASNTQFIPGTTIFTRMDGHIFRGPVLSGGSTRLRLKADELRKVFGTEISRGRDVDCKVQLFVIEFTRFFYVLL